MAARWRAGKMNEISTSDVHGTPTHADPTLTFPRSSPLRRLDARDRRVEGLVMDLMVCAAPESPTRPSLEEPRVSFIFAASSSFSRPDARFGGATEPRANAFAR